MSKNKLTAVALLAVVVLYITTPLNPFDDREFNQDQWSQSRPTERARMSASLINHLSGARINQEELVAILGQPDSISSDDSEGGCRVFTYYLGSWPIRAYDDTFLEIDVRHDDTCECSVIWTLTQTA
jgi:hypothetical protein